MNNLKAVISQFVNLAGVFAPLLGDSTLSIAERAATVPESDVRKMCAGMGEGDVQEAVRLARVLADAFSDFVVFVGSRGRVKPD